MKAMVAEAVSRAVDNPQQRELVWRALIHADTLHRYYGYLAERLEARDTYLAWAALLLSSGAFGILVKDGPEVLAQLFAILVAGASLWLIVSRYSRKATLSAQIQIRLSHVLVEYERLWTGLAEISTEEADRRYSELQQEAIAVTERASTELPRYEKLLSHTHDEVVAYWLGAQPTAHT